MRNLKTYVINFKTLMTNILVITIIFMLLLGVSYGNILEYITKSTKQITLKKSTIINSFPVLNIDYENEYKSDRLKKFLSIIFNENIDNPSKLICSKISFFSSIKDELTENYKFINESNYYYMPKIIKDILEAKTDVNIKYNPAEEITINSVNDKTSLGKDGISIKNNSGYAVDLNELYKQPLNLKRVSGKPQILIVHTHGSESYNPTDRNTDINNNVVRIGNEMEKIFNKNNIGVIHSEKMHDIPKFNNAYGNTLITINDILNKNPQINIVLDIHRDAMIKDDGIPYKVVTDINGQKASQIMFVVGTNKGGLTHNNWKENLKFAMHCQKEVNKISKNLARPINLRSERFNQHTTNGSLIIEIGTNGNTLNESIISAKLTAQAICEVIKKL